MNTTRENGHIAVGRGERGATISIALLLMLVCVSVCAIVLAAATASSGRFADLGKSDQRYYSVTSAAEYFLDSMGEDHEAVVSGVTQTRKGGIRYERGGVSTTTWSGATYDELNLNDVKIKGLNGEIINKGYPDYLKNLTVEALRDDTSDNLPFTGPDEQSQAVKPKLTSPFTYTITPTGDISEMGVVTVKGSLDDNWVLSLDFFNGDDEDAAETFHLKVILAGDVNSTISKLEKLQETKIVDGVVQNTVSIEQTQDISVTWRLQQVVPGGRVS